MNTEQIGETLAIILLGESVIVLFELIVLLARKIG